MDTVGRLVKMCEYYSHLFGRICAREPNAYMAMRYYDTELYRREKERDKTDYKAKALDLLAHSEHPHIRAHRKSFVKLNRFTCSLARTGINSNGGALTKS